jgi:hypothetical protein
MVVGNEKVGEKSENMWDWEHVDRFLALRSRTSGDWFLIKHQSTLRLTKSVLAVVVDNGATSKWKGRQL